jgi:hypothetical protein
MQILIGTSMEESPDPFRLEDLPRMRKGKHIEEPRFPCGTLKASLLIRRQVFLLLPLPPEIRRSQRLLGEHDLKEMGFHGMGFRRMGTGAQGVRAVEVFVKPKREH